MGFLSSMAEAFNEGRESVTGLGIPRIKVLCDDAGLSAAKRSENSLVIWFTDGLGRSRPLFIGCTKDRTLFVVVSELAMRLEDVPPDILAWAVQRNWVMDIGAWSATSKNGNAEFACVYAAFTAGLRGSFVRVICDSLVKETLVFNDMIRNCGINTF